MEVQKIEQVRKSYNLFIFEYRKVFFTICRYFIGKI